MNCQAGNQRVTRGTALMQQLGAAFFEALSIAHLIHRELKRLNRAVDNGPGPASDSRGEQARVFKAALAERYRDDTRCC